MELGLLECLPPTRMETAEPMGVGAVDDARPDRWGERVIQWVLNPGKNSLMEYLYFAGDHRLGALGVSTSNKKYVPVSQGPLPTLSDAQTIAEVVVEIQENGTVEKTDASVIQAGGSFGGAKPKALVTIEGQPWLLKFNAVGSNVDTSLIEHASMTLGTKAGLRMAKTQVAALWDGHAIAVERFDRVGGYRLHTLSASTILRAEGMDPSSGGYPALADWLRINQTEFKEDARELFARMVFNIAMDNTDDHEKNHAVLLTSKGWRLSPAYDVLPSMSGQGYQQFSCGKEGVESSIANALTFYPRFGLKKDEAFGIVSNVLNTVNGWEDHFRECGVSERDIEQVREFVDTPEKLAERKTYGVGGFPQPK